MPTHDDTIRDQFTRQAEGFATAASIKDEAALELLVDAAGATGDDEVLDVACGPGLVVCAFAKRVRHATGLDLTPAMLEQARRLQRDLGLENVTWEQGDVMHLPYPDGAFSVVCSRFAFHHFIEPERVLAEMCRVCRPGGRVVVADVVASEDPQAAERLNAVDKLRDPSHVRFRPLSELRSLFAGAGLPAPEASYYGLEGELEQLIGRSCPDPHDVPRIREIFQASVPGDLLGIGARREGDTVRFAYPVAILAAVMPAA